jgi:hypothetical protein
MSRSLSDSSIELSQNLCHSFISLKCQENNTTDPAPCDPKTWKKKHILCFMLSKFTATGDFPFLQLSYQTTFQPLIIRA